MTQAFIELVMTMSLSEAVAVRDSLKTDDKNETANAHNALDNAIQEAQKALGVEA